MNSYFEIGLVGNNQVGKTSFVNYHAIKSFDDEYCKTISDVISLTNFKFSTNYSDIIFSVKDFSGDQTDDNVKVINKNIGSCSAFIVMFDLTDIKSYIDRTFWIKVIRAKQLEH